MSNFQKFVEAWFDIPNVLDKNEQPLLKGFVNKVGDTYDYKIEKQYNLITEI